LIIDTFGRGCTKLYFVLDEASNGPKEYHGVETLTISLPSNKKKKKIFRVQTELNNFDWFIKADDDTFIMTENMRGFLQYYDPNYPHYLGHTLRARWGEENLIFNSGVCYVMSRGALNKLGPYISHLPSLPALTARSHCIDREGAGEDPTMGVCMGGVGIRPGKFYLFVCNTLDHEMRERFLIFRPEDHVKIIREDTWYWAFKPPQVKQGEDCCSPYIVCAHNYKLLDEAQYWYPILQEKYNQPKDWSKIPLPPLPRTFIYDPSQANFEFDDYFNIKNPPVGQRICLGPGKEWQCAGCNLSDPEDLCRYTFLCITLCLLLCSFHCFSRISSHFIVFIEMLVAPSEHRTDFTYFVSQNLTFYISQRQQMIYSKGSKKSMNYITFAVFVENLLKQFKDFFLKKRPKHE
ncbi:hypothetical protein RFI_21300, partial [Reticulomyxa filosa]